MSIAYERADGTIEIAQDSAEAFSRCPVLGELPMDQANVLLELLATPVDEIATEARALETEQPVEERVEETNEVEVKPQEKSTEPVRSVPALAAEVIVPRESLIQQEEITRIVEGVIAPPAVAPQKFEAEVYAAVEAEAETETKTQVEQRVKNVDSVPIRLETAKPEPMIEAVAKIAPDKTQKNIPVVNERPEVVPQPVELTRPEAPALESTPAVQIPKVLLETPAEVQLDQAIASGLELIEPDFQPGFETVEIVEPAIENYDVEVGQEVEQIEIIPITDEQVAQTYGQLLELLGNMDEMTAELELGSADNAPRDMEVSEVANEFEAFVEIYAKTEEKLPMNLEEIEAAAEDQPLEETLAQLATYLTEVLPEESETPTEKVVLIKQLLQEIEIELPNLMFGSEDPEKPQITPEVTKKLLLLLDAVGYKDPAETLVEFVREHELDYLLQAITYLYQLTNDAEQKEFLSLSFTSTSDEPITTRLGRVIFALIKIKPATYAF